MNITTKRITALGTATVAVMGAGVAFAAWTASGSGTGYAASSSMSAATSVSVVAADITNKLYPGGTGDVKIVLHNSNPFAVAVTVTKDADATQPGCDVSFAIPANTVINVPANSDSTPTVLAAAASMGNGAANTNSCQSTVFSLPLTLAASS